MRTVAPRSPWIQLAVALLALGIGPFVALRTGAVLAPDAPLVQAVGVFSFAATFLGGMLIWLGVGVARVIVGALWNVLRGRLPTRASLEANSDPWVPPGYGAFVVLGTLAGVLSGVFTWLSTSHGFPLAVGIWGGIGVAYGAVLWVAAHHGYLPFPEPQ